MKERKKEGIVMKEKGSDKNNGINLKNGSLEDDIILAPFLFFSPY